jgi:hypothetical protein
MERWTSGESWPETLVQAASDVGVPDTAAQTFGWMFRFGLRLFAGRGLPRKNAINPQGVCLESLVHGIQVET